jgi:dihydroflavonol-4-reductase
MPPVLVTGANGHVGNQLAAHLVERGYHVRAMVRQPESARQEVEILRHPSVEIVAGDIRDVAAVERAVRGCEGVFHVAAVYAVDAADPQRDIIDPAVNGALNVLRAARSAGVRRVVLTSSLTAIGNSSTRDHPLDESRWNDGATEPYARAKTLAERAARAFADESGLDLVCVNPTMVIGPGFAHHTLSTQLFENAMRGLLPLLPPLTFTFVDVRDVAAAHRLAYERPEANGRYLCGHVTVPIRDVFESMHRADPKIRVPRFNLPRAFAPFLPAMDWMQTKLLGTVRLMTAESLREYASGAPYIDNSRIRRELGWEPRDFDESVRDTIGWLHSRR